ncbi:hypothetical protein ACW4TU_19720 [Streptomyces sp. QTS52]
MLRVAGVPEAAAKVEPVPLGQIRPGHPVRARNSTPQIGAGSAEVVAVPGDGLMAASSF